jgi:hypothetical protein
MSFDIQFEFRINGQLWGLELGGEETTIDWQTMQGGWKCWYAPISFASHNKRYVVGVTKAEALATAITAIYENTVVECEWVVETAEDTSEFERLLEASIFAQQYIEANQSENAVIYKKHLGGRHIVGKYVMGKWVSTKESAQDE